MMFKKYLIQTLVVITAIFSTGAALAAPNANSPALLNQIARMNANADAIQSGFTQSKNVKGFNSPIKSSGTVSIVRNRGMLWVTDKPYQSTLKINQSGISEVRGGQTQQLGNTQSMSVVTQVMTGMMAGDFSSLQRYFSFTGQASGKSWSLNLKATDPQVKRVINTVQLRGGQFVQQAVINEVNGDITTVRFLNPHAASSASVNF